MPRGLVDGKPVVGRLVAWLLGEHSDVVSGRAVLGLLTLGLVAWLASPLFVTMQPRDACDEGRPNAVVLTFGSKDARESPGVPGTGVAGMAVARLPMVVAWLIALWHLNRLFALSQRGTFFERANAHRLKMAGVFVGLSAIFRAFDSSLHWLFDKWFYDADGGTLLVLDGLVLALLVGGSVLSVVGNVSARAAEMAQEQSLTV